MQQVSNYQLRTLITKSGAKTKVDNEFTKDDQIEQLHKMTGIAMDGLSKGSW